MIDRCTLAPDLWFGDCCGSHDVAAEHLESWWLVENWHLATCIYASTYSAKAQEFYKQRWKLLGVRYAFPPVYLLFTSTLGWGWRWKALITTWRTI